MPTNQAKWMNRVAVMKQNKHIIVPILLAMLSSVTSCNQEGLPPAASGSDVVEITAAIGDLPQTRVDQSVDNEYVFESGDAIHVVGWYGEEGDCPEPWAGSGSAWWNDAVSTYTASRWNSLPYMRWQNIDDEGDSYPEHHFIAWWPEAFARSTDDLTSVPFALTGDPVADDILRAEWSGGRPDDNTIRLQFDHIMARFDLNLIFRNQYSVVTDISVNLSSCTSGYIDLINGTVSHGDAKSDMLLTPVAANAGAFWTGTAIMYPQEGSDCSISVTFKADGVARTLPYVGAMPDFMSTRRSTLTLMVGNDKIDFKDKVTAGNWTAIDGGDLEAE